MRVTIDRAGCIGCGFCEGVCPEVFRLDDEGLSEVAGNPADHAAAVQEAADGCPVSVISISQI